MTLLNTEELRRVLAQLSDNGYNIIVFYNARCREETMRVFVYFDLKTPLGTTVRDYTVEGKDITEHLKPEKLSVQGAAVSNAMHVLIDSIPKRKYKFSADYSTEEYIA